jgi:hypothetical protein
MVTDRLTVSLDEQSRNALDDIVELTGKGQSELVRRALVFYVANFQAASTDVSGTLEEYHKMLASGEHVLLDIDFLHCLLEYTIEDVDDPDSEFVEAIGQVARFHATEYEDRFKDLAELLDWLSVCGFLTVRETEAHTYHVVFPSQHLRWFMTRFIEESTTGFPFVLDIEEGVSKVIFKQLPAED